MAVYKPNNFYPYQQEIDMESIDGNIFSCQANTDGALISGARLKILSAIDNTELYENIYQFKIDNTTRVGNEIVKTPYRNKEIIDMKIEPYEIFPEFEIATEHEERIYKNCFLSDFQFQSLCGEKVNYESKRQMCPYNFYLVKKNKVSLFKIKIKVEDINGNVLYDEIDFQDFTIDSISNNLFKINFNNLSMFSYYDKELNKNEDRKISSVRYFIVLKNNYDYLWKVRLYEHYFNENVDEGTMVVDGYITGTTKSVFWYSNITNPEVESLDSYVKKDNYLEVIADENNSDIFKEQILQNKVMSGEISQTIYGETTETQQLLKGTDGYILTDFNNGYVIYDDGYEVTDTGQIVRTGKHNIIWDGEYIDSQKSTFLLTYETEASYNNRQYSTIAIASDWVFMHNVIVSVNDDNEFQFDMSECKIGDYVPRRNIDGNEGDTWESYEKKDEGKETYLIDGYSKYPFLVPDCCTYVIAKKVNTSSEDEVIQDYAERTGSTIQTIVIDGNKESYYLKVLSPLPLCRTYYELSYYSILSSDNNYYLGEMNITTDGTSRLKFDNDILCFQKPNTESFKYNALIDIIGLETTSSTKSFASTSPAEGFKLFDKLNIEPYYDDDVNKNTYKIIYRKADSNSRFSQYDSVHQKFNIFNQKKIKLTGKYEGSPFDSEYQVGDISIILHSYSNSNYSEEYLMPKTDEDNKTILDEKNKIISYEVTIDNLIPDMYGELIIKTYNVDKDDNYYYDFEITTTTTTTESDIFLFENNVDFSTHLNDMYISFNYINTSEIQDINHSYLNEKKEFQKIKKINRQTQKIELVDKEYENELKSLLAKINAPTDTTDTTDPADPTDTTDTTDPAIVKYTLQYKKREKITWVTKDLGFSQDINKIETENEFNVNLKDKSKIYLYPSSDKNTYNSFFGERNTEFNVDNLYIRFPGYKGKDALGNKIQDDGIYYDSKFSEKSTYYEYETGTYLSKEYNGTHVSGPFFNSSSYISSATFDSDKNIWKPETSTWDKNKCPQELYGIKVSEKNFDIEYSQKEDEEIIDQYYNHKLFKVSSYNPDTGEFVIAGGLDRIILNTDRYEIWKKEAIEGSNNQYDITEVISTYTRLFPKPYDLDAQAYVNSSNSLTPDGIKIMNSNNTSVFIQPNANFSSDNNVSPYLILDDTEDRLNFNYLYYTEPIKYNMIDTTIDKLDNSQWLMYYESDTSPELIPGMTYKLYTDWADSFPSSYFYGRSIGEIELKYGDLAEINEKKASNSFSALFYDSLIENLPNVNEHIQGDYCVLSGINLYFIAKINNPHTKIQRYRYKFYNSDMELIKDSLDVWDNIIEYEISGLLPDEIYYLVLECEDVYGYEYVYETAFYSDYSIEYIPSEGISLIPLCSKNGIKIEIDPIYFNQNGAYNIDSRYIDVYRIDSTGKADLINTIDLILDKVYTGMQDYEYKYGFIDYNIRSKEYYEYLFILKKTYYEVSDFKIYTYTATKDSIHTNFDTWTIVEIIENPNTGIYETNGDVWAFRYNLEISEIVHNTSVVSWETLGPYIQMGAGEKAYDSSEVSCLLGDVGYYNSDDDNGVKKYGYHEKISTAPVDMDFEYKKGKTNNIDKYKKWKRFCRTNSLKLLKDMSGNVWIVGIAESPGTTIDTNTKEQQKTISFQWKEMMSSENVSIIGKLVSFDRKSDVSNYVSNLLSKDWIVWNLNDDITKYELVNINPNLSLESFEVKGSVQYLNNIISGTLITNSNPFKKSDGTYVKIKEYIFDPSLSYSNNSIANIFNGNTNIESINIELTDEITDASNAFNGCINLSTDNERRIEINTSNYINTQGMFDNTNNTNNTNNPRDKITISWNKDLTNETSDLLTYAELYEQYWDKEHIILECPQLEFDLSEWDHGPEIADLVTGEGEVKLYNYRGNKEKIFIPEKYIGINGEIITVILDDGFCIGGVYYE